MADLGVEPEGLRSAAASSESIASELGAGASAAATGSRASHAGIAAVDAGLSTAKRDRTQRVDAQSGYLRIGSGVYERHDDHAAEAIARTTTV